MMKKIIIIVLININDVLDCFENVKKIKNIILVLFKFSL